MITSEEIKRRLWDGANELRGSMDASRYKDYMLGLMFYKFLSDKTLEAFKVTSGLGQLSESELVEEYSKARAEYGEELDKMIQGVLGYYVRPEYLYQTWLIDINLGDFEVQKVTDSLNNFERTIAVSGDSNEFRGLFSSSTLDLTDTALGSNLNERSKSIKALILLFADLNMVALQKGDVLGDAYEYLIGQFAMESGKKAGEFYTPQQVSEVMAQIVAKTSNINSIYDPTVGSGSLLLTVKKHLNKDVQKDLSYYGQEKNTATYNLTRMNLLLHGVRPEKMTIRNGDTLSHDWPEDPERPNEGVQFDAVVMNPPYSAKNWNKSALKVSDPRFEIAGVLPPASKGDFAFLLHGLFHLGQHGTMAIVLPHGVLFRGSSEGQIRERLIDKNYIDAIIGLPNNLFTNTGIPVVVVILKKNRKIDEPVLIIDASRSFIKVGKQNVLQEKDIAKIVDTYVERRVEAGYSHLATRNDILENQYNLNIPRYIEAIDDEIPHDVDAHLLGGIPQKNIDDLKILQSIVPDVLGQSLNEIREGYVELVKPVNEISSDILSDSRIVALSEDIKSKAKTYIDKYWDILRIVDNNSNLNQLMDEMLIEIKSILSDFNYIDIYDGYQIVADIWKSSLIKDTEIVSLSDFYTAGRTREPNMVTKGTGDKKREEQDGWVGSIVPNDLIAKRLYSNELEEIESKKTRIQEIEAELLELVEAANVEDSDEANALGYTLNEDRDGIDSKLVKFELKKVSKGTVEFDLLKKVESLFAVKSELSKAVKADETALKYAVQERILALTDEEIDSLMYEKWFGSTVDAMISLVEKPLKIELNMLQVLHNRYADTVSSIDDEISRLELAFEELMSGLVVGALKSAYLSEMFPTEGEREPKRRFSGFTGAWEQREWVNTVDVSTNMVDPKTGKYDNLPHIGPGNIESFSGRLYDNVNSVKDDNLISGKFHFNKGDVIYGKINPQLGKYIFAPFEGLASADTYVLNAKNGLDQTFLFTLLQTRHFFKYSVSVSMRSGMPKINRDELNEYKFMAPSVEEQKRIGEFFLSLDNLTTLHHRKLEKLQSIKKACLHEMFV